MIFRYIFLKISRLPLRTQYLLFAGIVSWLIIIVLLWLSYSTYEDFKKAYKDDVRLHSQEVQTVLDERLAFVEYFMQFLGMQILDSHMLYGVNAIAKIIKSHRHDDVSNLDKSVTWNIVDFITESGDLIIDNINGIRRNPLKLPSDRTWLEDSKMDPLSLKFSSPAIGIVTHDYIIPCGLGVFDERKNKFLGFLSSGISVEKLLSSLLKIVDEHIVFAMFDDKFNLIMTSDPFVDDVFLSAKIKYHRQTLSQYMVYSKPVELNQYVVVESSVFSHYVHSTHFPFWFLVGYSQSYYSNEIWAEVIPKVVMNIILWSFFNVILIYLSYQVVMPIIMLGEAAKELSQGNDFKLGVLMSPDLRMLGQQLESISIIQGNYRLKQEQLTQVNNKLSAANEFIRGNMSFLSHELINPTATITEFARMLKDDDMDSKEDALNCISIMYDAALHLNKQLEFFMKIFRFQTENKIMENKRVNIKEIIEWNLSMIMHHARHKQVTINFSVFPEDMQVIGDEVMIGQMIQNLSANAAKYNKIGGKLNVKALFNDEGAAEIHFIDTGIGIDEDDMDGIFDLFKRGESTGGYEGVGYGIGLAYVQNCAAAHGARIDVESKKGIGTIFKVIFPAVRTVR